MSLRSVDMWAACRNTNVIHSRAAHLIMLYKNYCLNWNISTTNKVLDFILNIHIIILMNLILVFFQKFYCYIYWLVI